MSHDFELIEDASIAALTPLLSSGLKTLDTYSGQIEVGWEDLTDLVIQFPFIYVIAAGMQLEQNNRVDKYQASVTLLVGDRNLRGARAAARGDASSPGVYELLRLAQEALHNQKLLPGWAKFYLKAEMPLVFIPKESVCIYAAHYETKAMQ